MSRWTTTAKTRLAGAACAAGLAVMLAAPISAQEGEIIPGSECALDARPTTFLGEILATPVATEPYVMPTAIPTGDAPDDETVEAVTETVRQFIACSNSGEVLRALAVFDDEYLRRALRLEGGIDVDQANAIAETLATPIPIGENELITLLDMQIVQQEDGTVAVVLETDGGQPNPDGTDVDLFIFANVDDQWIIVDAVNDIDDIAAGATPAAGA